VLYDLERYYRIELSTLGGEIFHHADAIGEIEPAGPRLPLSMSTRGFHVLKSRIDAGHSRTHACQRFRNETSAAPDIQHRQSLERLQTRALQPEVPYQLVAYECQTRRSELVQGPELALRIPPF
jgi:hypothetical protein